MSQGQPLRIHPTAIIAPEAELADDVVVGPYAVIEGAVQVGPGCVIRPQAQLCGPLTMGCHNLVFTGAVLGERPQHLKYHDQPTGLVIGDHNIFREHVTVHGGTTAARTVVGSHNFFMAGSHVAHDCQVGNRCILANNALVGGHCVLEDNVYLSGNSAIHQFVRVGRLALLSGCSATTKDIPPFVIQQGINCIMGVNVVGMHRAGLDHEQVNAVRRACAVLFHEGNVLSHALGQVETDLGKFAAVAELVSFIRRSSRGVSTMRAREAA